MKILLMTVLIASSAFAAEPAPQTEGRKPSSRGDYFCDSVKNTFGAVSTISLAQELSATCDRSKPFQVFTSGKDTHYCCVAR